MRAKATSKTAVDLWKSRHSAYGQGRGKQKAVFHPLAHRLRKRVGFPTDPQLRRLFLAFFKPENQKTAQKQKKHQTKGQKRPRKQRTYKPQEKK
jgi:hypothetical protein